MSEGTGWRDISELTDDHLEGGDWHRLLFGNNCNGPHHPGWDELSRRYHFSADLVRTEDAWTHFMIIPKIPSDK